MEGGATNDFQKYISENNCKKQSVLHESFFSLRFQKLVVSIKGDSFVEFFVSQCRETL